MERGKKQKTCQKMMADREIKKREMGRNEKECVGEVERKD